LEPEEINDKIIGKLSLKLITSSKVQTMSVGGEQSQRENKSAILESHASG
jgi:hypothetical protein